MMSRNVVRDVVPLILLIVLGTVPGLEGGMGALSACAQTVTKSDAAGASRPAPSADEAAIRAVDEAFVRNYNKDDSKALAAMFTDDAEVVEADGARYQGRDLVERSFSETFAASKGARIALEVGAIRFLTPEVAKEEGRSIVTPVKGVPVSRFYTVLFVKRDGRWLMASVREEPDPLVRPHERLKELEWMVGEWVDEGSDSETRVNCHWSADGNFLLREFTVKRGGKPVMTVTQRVGWDPVAGEFRSWEFDSEGGFGEGRWSRDGDRWVVKQTGVRPEGVTASSTRVTVRVRSDLVRWTLFDRVIGGEAVPGEESSVLTRVPPAPRLGANGRATPSPSTTPTPAPNTARSPR
jgi:uncharacterized protein (TIGR02246 family)